MLLTVTMMSIRSIRILTGTWCVAALSQEFYVFCQTVLIRTLKNGYNYYPYFIEKKTEAHRIKQLAYGDPAYGCRAETWVRQSDCRACALNLCTVNLMNYPNSFTHSLIQSINICRHFPGSPVIMNPSCNTGDMGLTPGWGTNIPHDSEQLSLCATTTETMRCNERSRALQLRPNTAK